MSSSHRLISPPARPLQCLAATEENAEPAEAASTTAPAQQTDTPATPPTQKQAGLAPGQGTAIVTGAISIIFGIAYLALVQFMDMRGGELLPPPPEAYMQ